jgi:hypothetical protein
VTTAAHRGKSPAIFAGFVTHFLRVEDQAGDRALTARFAVRGVLALGAWR